VRANSREQPSTSTASSCTTSPTTTPCCGPPPPHIQFSLDRNCARPHSSSPASLAATPPNKRDYSTHPPGGPKHRNRSIGLPCPRRNRYHDHDGLSVSQGRQCSAQQPRHGDARAASVLQRLCTSTRQSRHVENFALSATGLPCLFRVCANVCPVGQEAVQVFATQFPGQRC
jgi:hypothetical protein